MSEQTLATTDAESVRNERTFVPRVDVYENEDELLLHVDLPGVRSDAVDLEVHGTKLTLQARRPADEHFEVPAVLYSRSFTIPRTIDGDRVEADVEQGVLRVHLPKTPVAKRRQIPVRTN
ncbi:MAG: Hsp20/alpha crystallin family protein [Myxococcota bacterium]